MKNLQELIQLMLNNGIGLIILAIVVYFAWHFGHIGLDFVQQKAAGKKHDELMQHRNEINIKIEEILQRLLLQSHACRAYVFEFKNGSYYLGGLGDFKMDCTYETLNGSAASQMHSRQNMPFSLFQSFIDMLMAHDYLVMDVNNREKEYSAFVYETLVQRGITKTVRAKITDTRNKVIGYLGIDYCKDPVSEDIVRESVRLTQAAAIEIGSLLSVNQKK